VTHHYVFDYYHYGGFGDALMSRINCADFALNSRWTERTRIWQTNILEHGYIIRVLTPLRYISKWTWNRGFARKH